MAKFPEAEARMFRNKFVCRRCKGTVRTSNMKVLSGVVTCRNCFSHKFKPKRKR